MISFAKHLFVLLLVCTRKHLVNDSLPGKATTHCTTCASYDPALYFPTRLPCLSLNTSTIFLSRECIVKYFTVCIPLSIVNGNCIQWQAASLKPFHILTTCLVDKSINWTLPKLSAHAISNPSTGSIDTFTIRLGESNIAVPIGKFVASSCNEGNNVDIVEVVAIVEPSLSIIFFTPISIPFIKSSSSVVFDDRPKTTPITPPKTPFAKAAVPPIMVVPPRIILCTVLLSHSSFIALS
mmetsp:Transcript_1285/g.1733  ORF Transcript_1285/g.1733 Transcript_1285/m.1733 type:complete len:238 (+) Transcript_1285:2050-2763(+)